MDRISAFTDLCTSAGLFRYGASAGGVPPTPLKAEYLNLIQEELCHFILAYLPTLDAQDSTQLLQSVRALILNYYTKPETDALIAALVDSSPAALDTLKELADALGRDPNFATTMTNLLAAKAPLASPALTGAPTAPTAGFGSKTKQLATTEFVQAAMAAAYPVGSVYMNANVNTSPALLLGFGEWVALAPGRMLIGVGSSTDARGELRGFSGGEQGGEYNHVLTINEMPSHNHGMPQGHPVPDPGGAYNYTSGDDLTTASLPNPPPTTDTGGGAAHNNLSPYLVVYMWKRSA
ncbi:hypothetical protein IMW75_26205 [Pseudomonas gregormendelii]|uniref:Baseplate structural protein Gp10 C-terminal domain-containing protein n=1 Tax=Pseudomonas gregormendelii TaxID=1628277 RepID=A0ABS3APD2_9PSED|nr:hypothetical protein [Pseudomonas gregormendelii]MBN3968747.1 hypothetical protein [Pseudomonas gregormendelii]